MYTWQLLISKLKILKENTEEQKRLPKTWKGGTIQWETLWHHLNLVNLANDKNSPNFSHPIFHFKILCDNQRVHAQFVKFYQFGRQYAKFSPAKVSLCMVIYFAYRYTTLLPLGWRQFPSLEHQTGQTLVVGTQTEQTAKSVLPTGCWQTLSPWWPPLDNKYRW